MNHRVMNRAGMKKALRLREFRSFSELPDPCLQLLHQAERHSLFFSAHWFRTFETRIAQGEVVLLAVFSNKECNKEGEEQSLALFPLWQRQSHCLHSLSNYYSSLYSPIIEPQTYQHEALLREVLTVFLQAVFERNICLDLQSMAYPSKLISALQGCAQQLGLPSHCYFGFGNWYLTLDSNDFSAYRQTLPSRLRHTLERKARQLGRQASWDIRIVQNEQDLPQALQDFQHIYRNSWKQPESHPEFVDQIIYNFAQRGQLRLGLLYVDEQPAAAQIWFVLHGKASIFKLAYDEEFAGYSVGSLLSQAMFKHVLQQDQVKEVDYLSGDDAYKKDWMRQRRERWGMLIVNPKSLRGFWLYLRHIMPGRLKAIVATAKS